MIRNLTFRSKLILLVAVPLCALVAVTVPGVTSRLSVVRAETRAQHLQGPSAAITQLVQALDNEHALSNWYVATGDLRVVAQLKAARTQTNRAVADLRTRAPELRVAGADSAAGSVNALLIRMQRAGKTRQAVDRRDASLESLNGYYEDSVREALTTVDAMGFSLRDASEVANLRDFATVLRLAAAAGQERALLTAGFAQGLLPSALLQDAVGAVAAQDAYRASFEGQASASLRSAFAARIRSGGSVSDPVRALRGAAFAGHLGGNAVAAQRWYDASTKQTEVLFAAARGVLTQSDHFGTGRKNTAQSEMLVYGAGALGALLLALGLAFVIARSATRSIRRLTAAADDVTERKLPHLLDALQSGGVPSDIADVTPVPVESRDEIGALARAFNEMEQALVDVAREQSVLLRRGVSELYVNLARRNQNLLERQIRMIDALERDEADPDRLGELFGVDHLATRMRRNAESLLVLASAEAARQWGVPVPLRDVVRSAASEIADYARVDVVGLDDRLQLTGAAVVDVTHLLAELLENATSFSPPDSRVVVAGEWRDSSYVLSITDRGIGIDDARVELANRVLSEPPAPGLALSRSLGLIVVSHLAGRTGAAVALHSDGSGTTASVTLPASLLATPGASDPFPGSESIPAPTADASTPATAVSGPVSAVIELPAAGRDDDATETLPRRVPGATAGVQGAPPAGLGREERPPAPPAPVEARDTALDDTFTPPPTPPLPPLAPPPAPSVPIPVDFHVFDEPGGADQPADTDGQSGDSVDSAQTSLVDDFLPHASDTSAASTRRARRRSPRPARIERASRSRGRMRRNRDGGVSDEWLDPERLSTDADQGVSWLRPEEPAPASGHPVAEQVAAVDRPAPPEQDQEPRDDDLDRAAAGRPLTAAGLPQRQPRDAATATPPGPPPDVASSRGETHDAPANRAPEQVMELLARFEAGRRRGALDAHNETAPTEARVPGRPEDD